MATTTETIMLGIRNDNVVQIGLLPKNIMDSYQDRALVLAELYKVSHALFSPDGEFYCVIESDLYAGPMPSSKTSSWLVEARKVGRLEWDKYRLLCFNPKGELYAVTKEGDLYKGPKPVNENRPWMYGDASVVAHKSWGDVDYMFFDPDGSLYAATYDGKLRKGPPPETTSKWFECSSTIAESYWCQITHFMSITPDGKLWYVNKANGKLYRGDPPTPNVDYLEYAEQLGWDYQKYKLCFTQDKTIHKIISLEFLPEEGKKLSENLEVIAEEIYDNRHSSSPLKHIFKVEKKITESSSFTHEHGFTVEVGVDTTVKAGIPFFGEVDMTIKVNTSTMHKWQFTETNQKEITISTSADVEIGPGKSVKMTASIMSAQIICPYKAKVETLFGHITHIKGNWKGASYYNLRVTQEDYKG